MPSSMFKRHWLSLSGIVRWSSARLLAALLVLAMATAVTAQDREVIIAGLPRYLLETPNYAAAFAPVGQASITAFFPVFQYQEVPESKGLDRHADFLLTQADGIAPTALRANNIRLMLPGDLLYPPQLPMPGPESDYLPGLIARLGREHVHSVVGHDEPWLNGIPIERLEAFYRHVKAIDPRMPIWLTFAPFRQEEQDRAAARREYIAAAVRWADIVAIDCYPIPAHLSDLVDPVDGRRLVDSQEAVARHTAWLGLVAPEKTIAMVLQGFAYRHLYEPVYREHTFSPATIQAARNPTRAELRSMADAALANGATIIGWWGQSHLGEDDAQLWQDILAVSTEIVRGQ